MTHKEWFARPDLVEKFGDLMLDPTLQIALDVVMVCGLPKSRFNATTANLIENHALLNAKREGYYECLQNLRTLATPRTKQEAELTPWAHAKSEET